MRTVPINEYTTTNLRAVWLEAEGPDALRLKWRDRHGELQDHTIGRGYNEPWFRTIDTVAEFLEAHELVIAGHPVAKKKRPRLLLAIDLFVAVEEGYINA